MHTRKVSVSWHESKVSFLEGVFARGDRRLGSVIEMAVKKGCRLDGWDECFHLDKWIEAFNECGIEPEFFANRKREFDEILPWDHLDYGVSKTFLINENKTAYAAITTPNCKEKCSNCGAACFKGGICVEKR